MIWFLLFLELGFIKIILSTPKYDAVDYNIVSSNMSTEIHVLGLS